MTPRSRRPYLIRAIHQWATDNRYTPHLLVAADYPGVVVPREFVQENRITLNIGPMAVQALDIGAEPIWFSARFGGHPFEVQVPTGAVLAIFAKENGEGVVFGEVEPPKPGDAKPVTERSPDQPPPSPPRPSGKPHLTRVK
ncbi:MAG: ClpXP protease specificity-enhancing factor [Stenotrophobium sp.]